jgi:hypothetical protein
MREEKQNITLALPRRLLKRVKVAAAKHDSSVSAILTRLLEDYLRREDDYERAMRESIETMKRGFEMGTRGKRTWTRDELHER